MNRGRSLVSIGKGLLAVPFVLAAAAFGPQAAYADGPEGPEAMSALELRVQELEEQLRRLRGEMRPAQAAAPVIAPKRNMVFFRGGYAESEDDRALGSFTDLHGGPLLNTLPLSPSVWPKNRGSDEGWYVGAGFEFILSDNLLGFAPDTWLFAEINIDWKNLGTKRAALAVPTVECLAYNPLALATIGAPPVPNAAPLVGGQLNSTACGVLGDDNVSMLTISASPKVKFAYWEGYKVRPWIIPAGLDFHVISPPSDAATVLDVGVQFAAGIDYEVIPGVTIGIDGRYHLASDYTDPSYTKSQQLFYQRAGLSLNDNQSNDNWTGGAYVGFNF